MPASHERVPNKPLSGTELAKIVEKDVHDILNKDGMFTSNIAFPRVAYEVRVTLHLDNPMYPTHEVVVSSKPASKQQVQKDPAMAAIEPAPLNDAKEDTVFSEERSRQIQSPNVARLEADMPILMDKKNLETGVMDQKEVHYTGDLPDPLSVGNLVADRNTSEEQRQKWNKPKRGAK